jgi:lipoprotein-anchoring transpeptidase ErfK/SrfK
MSSSARRTPILVAGLVAALLVVVVAAYAYDHSHRDVIASGVKIAGVDVGGLHSAAAKTKIQSQLVAPLARPVTVRAGDHTWHLSARGAGLTVDTNALVAQAVEASRSGTIISRTFRGLSGGRVNKDIPLEVSYSHAAVRNLTARVRAGVDRPAENASVRPTASGLATVAARPGVGVDNTALAVQVERALTEASAPRSITVPTRVVRPQVTTSQLASKYPAYIVIDRSGFTLRYYHRLKLDHSYPIAVGMQGLETPAGNYSIQWKQVNPPWYVPNSAWAGSLAGQTIPPGPQDPLKARFMSFDGGAGIHGIDPSEYSTIGHTASHGCVRMTIPDVIDLYAKTPVGTPVFIA